MHSNQASRFAILFLFGTIVAPYSVNAKQPHRKVLILGAGLSGIVAGKTLKDNGINDFLVLEGQDYIGGRIKQAEISGYKIEEGANFIHYIEAEATAPLWNKKKTKNLTGISSDTSNTIFRNETGALVSDIASYTKFLKALAKVDDALQERRKENKKPISAREGLSLIGWTPSTPFQYALEWLSLDFTFAKKVELLPFSSLEGITEEGEDDFFITDQRGVIELYKDLYKGFESKIKLNKTIVGIKYNSSFVEVTTKDGEVYTADFVLCTFSTGVLASDMVTFTPPLPDWKKDAIANRPLNAFTKIFVKFPKKIWDNNLFIGLANKQRGYYPVIMNLDIKGAFPGSGLMMMVVVGDQARRIEKQSLPDTKAEIVQLLRGIYGQNITEPTDVFYARWTQNPYVRGAYSDEKIGSIASKTSADLQKNLGNVYFSGEATSEEWLGYMQGAYHTGYKQAKAIAAAIKCKDEKICPGSKATRMEPVIGIFVAIITWLLFMHK